MLINDKKLKWPERRYGSKTATALTRTELQLAAKQGRRKQISSGQACAGFSGVVATNLEAVLSLRVCSLGRVEEKS